MEKKWHHLMVVNYHLNMNIAYYQYLQYLCLLAALFCYKDLKQRSLHLLLPLMVVVCIVETLAHYYLQLGFSNNYGIYNCWVIASVVIYYFIFDKLLCFKGWKRRLYLVSAGVTILFMLLEFFVISWGKYLIHTVIITSIQYMLICCLLVAQLVMDDVQPVRLSSHPYFWFAAGLLIFSAGYAILIGLHPYIRDNNLLLFGKRLYFIIGPMLNVILYSCFIIAIVLCSRYKQISPASS